MRRATPSSHIQAPGSSALQESVREMSTSAPPARRVLVVVRGILGWALLLAGLWFVWPSTLGGCTTLTVVSGHSMEPTYFTGDLVVARCGTPAVGDVVVYRPTEVSGTARIIHRIVGGSGTTGWQMKGDNNSFDDPFRPTNADVVGVAVLHLPQVGRISVLLLNPWLWAGVILVALVLLIWPSGDDEDSAAEGNAAADDEAAVRHDDSGAVSDPAAGPTPGPALAGVER